MRIIRNFKLTITMKARVMRLFAFGGKDRCTIARTPFLILNIVKI